MDADKTPPEQAHDHVFGLDEPMPGEHRTLIVTAVTGVMMIIEIAAGVAFGSMALLADGLHMASHAAALAIAYIAYVYARRRAADERFSFGTGKVNALAGFSGALLLAVFALMMAVESVARFLNPVTIQFDQAILVAVVGLVVNAASAVILAQPRSGEQHAHSHSGALGTAQGHSHHDHNLRSAYLHVVADALTSLLAIFALLAGKFGGANWLDPAMGVVGALLVARWSAGLIRASAAVLLDRQAPPELCDRVRHVFERQSDTRVHDLHIWTIGPQRYAAIIELSVPRGLVAQDFKTRLSAAGLRFDHVTIAVNERAGQASIEADIQPAEPDARAR